MKQAFRIVLFLFVLYLSFKPMIDFIKINSVEKSACCENTCHTEKKDAPNPFKEDKCFGKNCNPFQFCSTCSLMNKTAGIILIEHGIPVQFQSVKSTKQACGFLPKLYQPPQA